MFVRMRFDDGRERFREGMAGEFVGDADMRSSLSPLASSSAFRFRLDIVVDEDRAASTGESEGKSRCGIGECTYQSEMARRGLDAGGGERQHYS
jgi:hypothetical protein